MTPLVAGQVFPRAPCQDILKGSDDIIHATYLSYLVTLQLQLQRLQLDNMLFLRNIFLFVLVVRHGSLLIGRG